VPIAAIRHVSAEYAETMGLTLLRGRLINTADRADTLRVAVITEEMARQAFGTEDPIGKRFRRGRQQETGYPWMVVVGVVRDTKEDRLNFRIARPVLYVPFAQRVNPPASAATTLVVRSTADPLALASAVRNAISGLDSFQPVVKMSSMDAMLDSVLSADRFSARLMAMLAGVGLFLAALGLYGVIAYSVTQRTCEIGLRVALGARPRSVIGLIAREGGLLIAVGLALSVPMMLIVAKLLAGVLFGVNAHDPAVLLVLAGLVAAVAFTACVVPARRALRLDPVKALQFE
jgi:putative ABC transport system permease protein